MAPAVRLGLTGGIGSGKSTVARFLAELGAAIVDTDAIARDLTAPGGLAMPSIAAAFGQAFI
ncbi:MAG: dephospho-CoA kinase, partial [Rhodoferax sp.]|nr:dephospho-CoA kinase [Rhodoferax sp.]